MRHDYCMPPVAAPALAAERRYRHLARTTRLGRVNIGSASEVTVTAEANDGSRSKPYWLARCPKVIRRFMICLPRSLLTSPLPSAANHQLLHSISATESYIFRISELPISAVSGSGQSPKLCGS